MKFILCCVTSDLSDNLTEMRIVKNSNRARLNNDLITNVKLAQRVGHQTGMTEVQSSILTGGHCFVW